MFIGPPASAIEAMGSKTRARELMKQAGVPIVPGTTEPVDTVADALSIAKAEIGFPVAVKAAGGGGGKGFRVALSEDELEGAFEGASREGEKFFSDPTVYLERYLPDPRHVEVQVLADSYGNVIHLGERDCSIQRRHQKLIEESPAPEWVVDPQTRERIGQIGVDAARAVGYVGAGTIEGLFSEGEGDQPEYFFLEMNTRVQVEHCVTEMTTGIDIVKEGIRAAAGEELSYAQADVELRGHAIECRINAEDASKNFAPAPGRIGAYSEPTGPGVRVDSGVRAGGEVSPMYDPMVAKLIVWDADRAQATARMLRALGEFEIEGLKTLIPFHKALLATEQWAKGETCRDLVEDRKWLKTLAFPPPGDSTAASDSEEDVRTGVRRADIHRGGVRQAIRRARRRPPIRRRSLAGRTRREQRRLRGGRRAGPDARTAQVHERRRSGHAALAAAGQHVEGARQAGRHRRGGPAAVHHRGDEDGERDHRPQGGHDRRASDRRGRRDPGGSTDRDDQERRRVTARLERRHVLAVQLSLRGAAPAVGQLGLDTVLGQGLQIGGVLLEDAQSPISVEDRAVAGDHVLGMGHERAQAFQRGQVGLQVSSLVERGQLDRRQVVAGHEHQRPGNQNGHAVGGVTGSRVQLELAVADSAAAGHG